MAAAGTRRKPKGGALIRRLVIASLIIALSIVLPARAASHPGNPQPRIQAYFHAEIQEQVLPSPLPTRRPKAQHRSTGQPEAKNGPSNTYSPWPHAPSCCGPSSAEVQTMISATFGANAAAALAVANCESHYDWQAQNPYSGAAGIFQFIPGWWWDGGYKWNVWDAQANISTAYSASSGGTDWSAWSCKP